MRHINGSDPLTAAKLVELVWEYSNTTKRMTFIGFIIWLGKHTK